MGHAHSFCYYTQIVVPTAPLAEVFGTYIPPDVLTGTWHFDQPRPTYTLSSVEAKPSRTNNNTHITSNDIVLLHLKAIMTNARRNIALKNKFNDDAIASRRRRTMTKRRCRTSISLSSSFGLWVLFVSYSVCFLFFDGNIASSCAFMIHDQHFCSTLSHSKQNHHLLHLSLLSSTQQSTRRNSRLQVQPQAIYATINATTLNKTTETIVTKIDESDGEKPQEKPAHNHIRHKSNRVVPKHVAFICDGNSRWANQRHIPTAVGHLKGADRLVELFEGLQQDGIEYCTLYGFSTENWNRPAHEINEIFKIMEQTARTLSTRVKEEESIRIRLLGDFEDERIPKGLQEILHELQSETDQRGKQSNKDETKSPEKQSPLTVCLAINYSGRQDILQASQLLVQKAISAATVSTSGDLDFKVSKELFESCLSTHGIPDPDLIIRTSGEHRLSNFLLWNCAYSEIYITNVLWPDFDPTCWKDALAWYQHRQRRFGGRRAEERKNVE